MPGRCAFDGWVSTDIHSGGHRARSDAPVRTASAIFYPVGFHSIPSVGGFLFVLGHSLARRLQPLHLLPCSPASPLQARFFFSHAFDVSLQHVRTHIFSLIIAIIAPPLIRLHADCADRELDLESGVHGTSSRTPALLPLRPEHGSEASCLGVFRGTYIHSSE